MHKWFSTVVMSVAASLMVFSSTAIAATPTASTAPASGQGLEISPPVIELNADPGMTVTTNIRVRNVASNTLIARGKADDFGSSGEDGKPQILLDETEATRYSLKYWVQGVPDLRLAPQELKTATITIAVPKNAEPGGHYGVIRFTGIAPEMVGTGVALSASVGTLILLKVSGNITDKLSIAQFTSTQNGKNSTFFEHGPVGFTIRVKNEGTVHEKVGGTITITDALGKKIETINVNEKGGNVLPGSIRKFDETMTKKNLFGSYTAKLFLTYTGGQVLNSTITFWVLPWKIIAVVIIVIILIFFLLRFALRKYNKYVIAQARKR